MENDSALADPNSATDSLDEYDSEESSSVDDGTLIYDRYLDRELSWLAFNQRVLELAEDPAVPLLERANFLAIFASNLDEFFMVRVAGLKRRIDTGLALPSNTGRAPIEVLEELSVAAHALQERHAAEFSNSVKPALDAEGIHIETWADLGPVDRERVHEIFSNQIFPVLMPLAVDPAHPFPYISGLSLNLSIRVRNPKTRKEEFARLKVPSVLPRFIQLPDDGSDQLRYIPLEDLISNHLGALFPGMEILAHHEFRVTRNEDVNVDEDESENLIKSIEKQILNRRFGPPIRLEITDDMDAMTLGLLVRELKITTQEVYRLPAPLNLAGLFQLARTDRPALKYPRHVPITSASLMPAEGNESADIFRAIARKDVLLHHPYESFSTSVQSFLEQAAADPDVLAIKQTLHRTSGDSPIVEALITAAEAGKAVLALVEIKARFDETANISWARKLEKAGVHVVYGLVGLKTHCKLALVVRREDGQLRHYAHIGTGNYNPKTARYYEDFGLLTSRESVGEDLTQLFNQLSGFSTEPGYSSILTSPVGVREGLVERIQREITNKENGKPAKIRMKLNSLVDEQIIDQLYFASIAGVPIEILVRGMCALKPGIEGLSENVKVVSVLGRYLEHSRVFFFENAGDPDVFIGSADMMHRNLDRRVESLVQITQTDQIKELNDLLELAVSGTVAIWELESSGIWRRDSKNHDGEPLIDMQDEVMARTLLKKRVR